MPVHTRYGGSPSAFRFWLFKIGMRGGIINKEVLYTSFFSSCSDRKTHS